MREMLALCAAAALLLLFGGSAVAGGIDHDAGGGAWVDQCRGFARGPRIELRDNCFHATAQFVAANSTVTVTNAGQIEHTYTAVDGSFDSGLLEPGQRAQIKVGQSGVYEVYCTLHSSANGDRMAGVLIVQDRAAAGGGSALDAPEQATVGRQANAVGMTAIVAASLTAVSAAWIARRARSRGGASSHST